MIFVLPLSDELDAVQFTELLPALDNLQSTRVAALAVPKYKFESTYDDNLKAAIIQTGIEAPFSAGSLCGLKMKAGRVDCLLIRLFKRLS